ncbi:hypothetical protein [Nostoc favosum]|uniref:hypothetical protein n=1 Tax=Nostoc favosum TaxID=2907819 RepID=UPI0027954AEC|nr:hypothetical protein [Nostoc favosum]
MSTTGYAYAKFPNKKLPPAPNFWRDSCQIVVMRSMSCCTTDAKPKPGYLAITP